MAQDSPGSDLTMTQIHDDTAHSRQITSGETGDETGGGTGGETGGEGGDETGDETGGTAFSGI